MKILFLAYDNEHFTTFVPQSLAALSAVLVKAGHEVEIWNQDVHHFRDEELTNFLDDRDFGLVGLGMVAGYYPYRRLLGLSAAVNASKNRDKFIYVLGGHGPSPEPEFFLKKSNANIVVIGEGEETIIELTEHLAGRKDLETIDGIVFKKNGEFVKTKKRQLIADINSLPMPAYELFPMEIYRLVRAPGLQSTDFAIPMLSGRGCKFRCTFCYRLDKGLRIRSNESIVEEIEYLKSRYRINYIMFTDELLMSSVERTIDLCNVFIKYKLNIKWSCNGRLNIALPGVMKKMKEAGCQAVVYGVESYNNEVLKIMKKGLNTDIISRGVQNTIDNGIAPWCGVMFGNVGETKEHLQNSVSFIKKFLCKEEQMRTIRPVAPYPGSPLYYYAIEKGLLKDVEDFYENKLLNSDLLSVNFTNMSDEDFTAALCQANTEVVDYWYSEHSVIMKEKISELYSNKDKDFKGFRRF